MKLVSPKGTDIIGTFDKCPCTAHIAIGSAKRLEDGSIDFDFAGSTEMFYDDQYTVMRAGEDGKEQRVFLDENGEEFLESELKLVEDDDGDDV